MTKTAIFLLMLTLLLLGAPRRTAGQSTTGSISGIVADERQAAIANATVSARHTETNVSRTAQADIEGRYRFESLPIGSYEVTIEANGFAKYVQRGITLALDQDAVVDVTMRPATLQETVTVTENASLLNTTNAEVGVRFDSRRIAELPLAPNRNVYNIVLSAPGVSQLGSGQTSRAAGLNFSVNGGRVRSNSFLIDGQDTNDPGITGRTQALNNPDIVQEVRLLTSQFAPEYGHNAGSIVSIITKSGTNNFHGSLFWFHNDNHLNARSNLNKAAGFTEAPFRLENQFGATLGGPVVLPRFGEGGRRTINGRDRTWFFASLQRWSNRQLSSGFTINGVPTEQGRQVLQAAAGARPQITALLKHLPVAQASINRSATFRLGGQTFAVPLGSLTGSSPQVSDDWQSSARIDHQINARHRLSGRYLFNDSSSSGTGQVTPPGLAEVRNGRRQAMNLTLTSVLSPRIVNELRLGWHRFGGVVAARDPSSAGIPSIQISELGLQGTNGLDRARTAIGLGTNLPQSGLSNTYQLQDNFSYTAGNHAIKFGFEVHRIRGRTLFSSNVRGSLSYVTLQRYVDDIADAATVNRALPGGETVWYTRWHDVFLFWQDEWKVKPNLTLTYGLRYELPGNQIATLVPINQRIVAAAGGDSRYAYSPVPERDTNNFQPRFGFNWNPRTSTNGFMGLLTGGDRLVLRGGYARTNDHSFDNLRANIYNSFPFVAAVNLPRTQQPVGGLGVSAAFARLTFVQPSIGNPLQLSRTIVGEDFRSPIYEQFSLEAQRELARDLVMKVGYVGTKGTALFQNIQANPLLPFSTSRLDPMRGPIIMRANAASSIYHSLQASLDKRLSRGFSAGVHYTWSAFIDDASDVYAPSSSESASAQNPFDRRADRARSAYDRPHRFTGNFVYELPFFRAQTGLVGHLFGGWQVNSFFTFQNGAPFTVFTGSDIDTASRPNLNTPLPLSSMTLEELLQAGGARLFSPLGPGQYAGNVGRNTLRADGIGNIDFGIFKNTRLSENQRLQLRAELYNATNTRNFGIPDGNINSANFLNQWGTDGGSRRIVLGLRYTF